MAPVTVPNASSPVNALHDEDTLHILWMNAVLSCDGDSVALTAATQPSIEDIVLGALPGFPKVQVHWPPIHFYCGPMVVAAPFIAPWFTRLHVDREPSVHGVVSSH